MRWLSLPLLIGCLAACGSSRPARAPGDQPYETFDQDNYSNVPNHGPGAETSGAYYGTGNAPSTPPERTPASPSAGERTPH